MPQAPRPDHAAAAPRRQAEHSPDPTAEATQRGEIPGGDRGALSGRNQDQQRAAGQDSPTEGSRQGRERLKSSPDAPGDTEPDRAL